MNDLAYTTFIQSFNFLAAKQKEAMDLKGFKIENKGEAIALMHSELSEALEGLRHNDPPSEHIPEFTASEEEFADTIIRLLHYAGDTKARIAEAVIAKMEFNLNRPYKHGKKF